MMMRSQVNSQIRKVARSYGLEITKLTPCASFYKSNSAYKADTKQGTFLIKPFIGSEVKLRRITAYMKRLENEQYPYMPSWRTNLAGTMWIRKNNKLYYVTDWIDGQQLGEAEQDYMRVGKALATLHAKSIRIRNWKPRNVLAEVNQLRVQNHKFLRRLPFLQNNRTEQGKWFKLVGSHCKLMAEEACQILDQPSTARKLKLARLALVHNDVTIPNIINSVNQLYLIDWECSYVGSIYYEIVRALANTTLFNTGKINAFLTEYTKFRPLDKQEKMIISALFRLPREVWYLGLHSNRGSKSTLFQIVRDTWSKRMEAIHWVDEWAKA
ncbi:hypothetical protein E0485_02455 [Paenibacillus albiflavus]|uniref:Aminoglycoside phosphotransferase domain-containing protein n=1 Tax=Paenibacillus albiflavus TaxID=2545760 RepID=A0A4R4EMS0_9BACL|nr:phosphotransferase [Paenibacillus albiflavus]TCZ81157.1 hypothetical protein E0485_02455 [Paenibacillus albiflavus]